MLWHEIISKSTSWLAAHNVPDPAVASELFASHLLKTSRGFLSPHLSTPVSEPHLAAMRRALARLKSGEPIQYILGEWDFRSLTLHCDRRALIPRPETEGLVSLVLASRTAKTSPHPFVVDVCTGSGCIALSIASELPSSTVLGLDISPDAISLARENAAFSHLSHRVKFAVADGLDDLDEPQCIDILVSNPPYIPTPAISSLDPRIRNWEPRLALDGGPSGLDFYERFIADAIHLLKPSGEIFFEIGSDQASPINSLLFEAGFTNIKILSDLASLPRYATATLP